MISHLIGTDIDRKTRSPTQSPAYQVLLYSRWQDTDSDIARGLAHQTPIDLTSRTISMQLVLDMDTDASSLNATISVEGLNLSIFTNCVIVLREGEASVDQAQWPTTFTGWRIGQPGSTESAADGRPTPEQGRGPRGSERTLQIQFHGREKLFAEYEITSDGVWLPNGKSQTEQAFQYRNQFDNIGDIAREVCENPEWGLGLTQDEVIIAKQPYRIEKQLQFVQISAWEALQNLLEVLHLTPGVNGEGKIVVRDRKMDRPAARVYGPREIVSIAQPDASFTEINTVIARGLSKRLTEVLKKDQMLAEISGTAGYFRNGVTVKNHWSDHKGDGGNPEGSYLVKVGSVTDGDGKSVTSPRIRRFKQESILPIDLLDAPEFVKVDEFKYEIFVEQNLEVQIGVIAALIGGYSTLSLTAISSAAGGDAITATAAQAAADFLLITGIMLLQSLGHFEFEIWGVPYETVYEEVRVDAILGHFGARAGNTPFREFERKDKEIQNYILSTEEDSVVPDTANEPEVTNPGVRSFARRELAICLAEQAKRQLVVIRDILLEPADIIEDQETGRRYFIKSISRTLQRGEQAPVQECEAHLLPELP